MNIAIFGGSFDPPHLGHDMIVKEALKSLNINKLIIIPTFLSPFKSEFGAPPLLRFQWCNELWSNLDEKIIISDYDEEIISIFKHVRTKHVPKPCDTLSDKLIEDIFSGSIHNLKKYIYNKETLEKALSLIKEKKYA